MNISTVNELIASLESAGELSIKERKYLDLAKAYVQLAAMWEGWKGRSGELTAALATIEKCRELSGCPAGVDLQDHLRQLAAENVTMLRLLTDISENHVEYFSEGEDGMFAGVPLDYVSEINMYVSRDVNAENPFPATDSIYAGIKASAIPEGFKLVPEQMYLSAEDIQAICMQCGNGDEKGHGEYVDGILWVGELSNEGEIKYGLNIANADYPEEGSITVFEFDEQLREGAK